MSETHYAIKVVARITGLTPHVIRVWEKRYGAVNPTRTPSNRRVYSQTDVQRLLLLREATSAGHSIGQIASLADARLAAIAAECSCAAKTEPRADGSPENALLEQSLQAIRQLDGNTLEATLRSGVLALGPHGLLERLVCPLVQRIGCLWREGELKAVHEHFATVIIRNFLGRNSRPFPQSSNMPTLVVATPSGQLHEMGAVMVGTAAADVGWKVVYLGTSLPAAEIAAAALQHRARAVALSIVYPEDDPALPDELQNLRSFLPAGIRIIVGGRAAGAYQETLDRIGVLRACELRELYAALDQLRLPSP
jgi:DNA-binding transcriptional MerR regulator/methylmalonyl-CoA mutase cobalamin-binding subunit